MSSRGIYISLPDEVLEEIDSRCGGPKQRAGKSGGRAAWVRSLIYDALGREQPVDVHEKRRREFERRIRAKAGKNERTDWQSTVVRMKELREEGLSLRQVARVLKAEGRATKRGGKWTAQTVRNVLLRQ